MHLGYIFLWRYIRCKYCLKVSFTKRKEKKSDINAHDFFNILVKKINDFELD